MRVTNAYQLWIYQDDIILEHITSDVR